MTLAITPKTGRKIGLRPSGGEPSGRCGGCGHPVALHSNGKTACRAKSCTAGPGGTPCQGFDTAKAA